MFAHLIFTLFLTFLNAAAGATCNDLSTCFPIRIGKLRAYVVSAGPIEIENFFSVPDDALFRSYRLNNRGVSPLTLSMNTLVVDLPTGRLLVDTGLSKIIPFPGSVPGSLQNNLRKAGLWPASIRYIALTHAHVDHVAGLRRDDGRKAFPNATVYISETEHKFWIDPQLPFPSELVSNESFLQLAAGYNYSIYPYLDTLRFVNDKQSPIPGLQFFLTPGHSPGHMSVEISSEGDTLRVAGDTWITRADQLQNLEWGYSIEFSRETAFNSRVDLLDSLAKNRTMALAYHEPFPGLGYVSTWGPFYDWTPVSLSTAVL